MHMDSKRVDGEVKLMLDIVNDAWSDNWGFVAMTDAEAADMATMLKMILKPRDVAIAEYKGEPMAFVMTIPDMNEAARDLNGHLFPFGIFKLLWRLKVTGTRRVRMALMGVRKSLHASPIGAALALAVIKDVRDYHVARGATHGELSWVLDRNEAVKHVVAWAGAKPYKRYRIYGKALDWRAREAFSKARPGTKLRRFTRDRGSLPVALYRQGQHMACGTPVGHLPLPGIAAILQVDPRRVEAEARRFLAGKMQALPRRLAIGFAQGPKPQEGPVA